MKVATVTAKKLATLMLMVVPLTTIIPALILTTVMVTSTTAMVVIAIVKTLVPTVTAVIMGLAGRAIPLVLETTLMLQDLMVIFRQVIAMVQELKEPITQEVMSMETPVITLITMPLVATMMAQIRVV